VPARWSSCSPRPCSCRIARLAAFDGSTAALHFSLWTRRLTVARILYYLRFRADVRNASRSKNLYRPVRVDASDGPSRGEPCHGSTSSPSVTDLPQRWILPEAGSVPMVCGSSVRLKRLTDSRNGDRVVVAAYWRHIGFDHSGDDLGHEPASRWPRMTQTSVKTPPLTRQVETREQARPEGAQSVGSRLTSCRANQLRRTPPPRRCGTVCHLFVAQVGAQK
jgi:hypothetical protein